MTQFSRRRLALVIVAVLACAGIMRGTEPGQARKNAPDREEKKNERGATIGGEVVDAKNLPIDGADVWLVTLNPMRMTSSFVHATSDRQGRFQVRIPVEHRTPMFVTEVSLVIYKPGFNLQGLALFHHAARREKGRVPPGSLRFVLEPAQSGMVKVERPDGRPMADAQVNIAAAMVPVCFLHRTEQEMREIAKEAKQPYRVTANGYLMSAAPVTLPDELLPKLSGVTDGKGTVIISGLHARQIGQLLAKTKEFGTQNVLYNRFMAHAQVKPLDVLRLRPVGSLKGRIRATSPEDWHGLSIRVTSTSEIGLVEHEGREAIHVDAEGRFEVPHLVAGAVSFKVDFPAKSKALLKQPPRNAVKIEAGKTSNVEVDVLCTIPVRGRVIEEGSRRPIGNIHVVFDLQGEFFNDAIIAESNEKGEFTVQLPAGQVYFAFTAGTMDGDHDYVPFKWDEVKRNRVTIPDGVKEFRIAEIVMKPAGRIAGVVVDGKGAPVPYAELVFQATIAGSGPYYGGPMEKIIKANERGEFVYKGLVPKTAVLIRAWGESGFSGPLEKVDQTRTLRLSLSFDSAWSVRGRLVDPTGTPFANVRLQVKSKTANPVGDEEKERDEPAGTLKTDVDGKFASPAKFEPGRLYKVQLNDPGFPARATDWLTADKGKVVGFPDLIVGRYLFLRGRIVDRAGKPVADARIARMHKTDIASATSDAGGQFRVAVEDGGVGFLFVEKEGFRFHGQELIASAWPVTLSRLDEPGATKMKTVPMPLSAQERRALAGKYIDPMVGDILKKKSLPLANMNVLQMLAGHDPAKVQEILDQKIIPKPYDDTVRLWIFEGLLKQKQPDEAQSVLETMSDSLMKAHGYGKLLDAAENEQSKRKLLDQVLLQARNTTGERKPIALTLAARRLRQLGDAQEADKMLREIEPAVRKLPYAGGSGYVRGLFAREFARLDPEAALDIISKIPEKHESGRHHSQLAMAIAVEKPAAAEKIALLLLERQRKSEPNSFRAERLIAVLGWHWAPTDLRHAQKLADQITNVNHRALAYGMMARRIAKTNPREAAKLLRQAYDLTFDTRAKQRWDYMTLPLAGVMLGVAEEIDPALVPEFFWRTLAKRNPRHDAAQPDADAGLAQFLARYQPKVAATVFSWQAPHDGSETYLREATLQYRTMMEPAKFLDELARREPGRDDQRNLQRVLKLLLVSDADFWEQIGFGYGIHPRHWLEEHL